MNNLFDLNIEQVLEHWGSEHALREIIANAIDEQTLTNSRDIEIFKDSMNKWHIKDFGRGIQSIHFTQNENQEKLQSENLIGKFGVGLKDALAVFNRHNIDVQIHSKYAKITLEMSKKIGFNIETLHARFEEPIDSHMIGTEFIIKGITSDDIDKAKMMFLKFSDALLFEKTKFGEVYSTQNGIGYIYVNGVQVAVEPNFMFSYNITNINVKIKKALNRERSNVGRTAYSDSVKKVLTECKNKEVLLKLVEDLDNIMLGTSKDESSWIDVSAYAAQTLNESENVVFLTPYERSQLSNQQVEILNQSDKEIILVTDNLKEKLGNNVITFSNIMQEYNDSFEYKFIEYNNLTPLEKSVFDTKDYVISFLKNHDYRVDAKILISETIRINEYGETTYGLCDRDQIIIRRKALTNEKFFAVLLHEFAHYHSGYSDNTREFENVLTNMLGELMTETTKNGANNISINGNGIFSWIKRILK